MSTSYELKQGMRQGGILSTDLYKAYTDGLLHEISRTNLGFFIGNICLGAIVCADDVILLTCSVSKLQDLMDETAFYAKTHR